MTPAIDLFDSGRDPFSPVALRANSEANCEVVPTVRAEALRIVVIGTPRPQGSKRAFVSKKTGRAFVVDDNDVKLRTWRQDVVAASVTARKAANHERFAPHAPVAIVVTFLMPRPKAHWRTGRNAHLLRDDAPMLPTSKPDVDKLLRATCDALKDAGVYVDDAQVVDAHPRKVWASDRPGALIEIISIMTTQSRP